MSSDNLLDKNYKYGERTNITSFTIDKGLSEKVIRLISEKRNEPQFVLDFRLNAYNKWLTMTKPKWGSFNEDDIDFQDISYYSVPKNVKKLKSLDEVDPEILATFNKLGVPLSEQKRLSNVAVDAVFDSVSIATTFKKKLLSYGVIFCSFSEAVNKYPDIVKKYLGSVVPIGDNFYSALNSAVFTDGSFVYIPPDVKCPMDLSSYFRINTENTGQFERTLIVCDRNSSVSYLEGCTAPSFSSKQLHAAVVEIVALDYAKVKYSTVQNWYAGDKKTGKGGVYNFVTKRGKCLGYKSHISWTQVETGSAITWKYPSCVLKGDYSVGEFYSVALTSGYQQADTGSKMIHLGKNTKSTIISKGISADYSSNTYRGKVRISKNASNSRNYTQCDSMLIKDKCIANTFPYVENKSLTSQVEHEASVSKVSDDQLFYFYQRGIDTENAIGMIVNGMCRDVFKQLPLEFTVEASKLLEIKLENSVG